MLKSKWNKHEDQSIQSIKTYQHQNSFPKKSQSIKTRKKNNKINYSAKLRRQSKKAVFSNCSNSSAVVSSSHCGRLFKKKKKKWLFVTFLFVSRFPFLPWNGKCIPVKSLLFLLFWCNGWCNKSYREKKKWIKLKPFSFSFLFVFLSHSLFLFLFHSHSHYHSFLSILPVLNKTTVFCFSATNSLSANSASCINSSKSFVWVMEAIFLIFSSRIFSS